MNRVGVMIAIALLESCGKTTSSPPASTKPTMTCGEIFAPPAGGELLCDEHVVPSTGVKDEIHWRSWGLPEPRTAYCDRYLDAARACNFGFTFKPPLCDVDDNKGRRAELFYNDKDESGGWPTCAKKPDAKHKTVIVVSEKHSP
jgi:hypothetical protein